jgi:hypothetical protein
MEVSVDQYRIPLLNGRSLALTPDQLGRIARGLGEQTNASLHDGEDPLIVEALRSLLPTMRANALSVALMRFAQKQDIESISHACGLSPWEVWQLEEAFLQAIAEARASRLRPRAVSAASAY